MKFYPVKEFPLLFPVLQLDLSVQAATRRLHAQWTVEIAKDLENLDINAALIENIRQLAINQRQFLEVRPQIINENGRTYEYKNFKR